jgi:hypothetical protein
MTFVPRRAGGAFLTATRSPFCRLECGAVLKNEGTTIGMQSKKPDPIDVSLSEALASIEKVSKSFFEKPTNQ